MPLINLFLSVRGRISRGDFWYAALLILSVFTVLSVALEATFGRASTWLLYAPLYWSSFAVSSKRYHDIGRSGWWLLLLLVPLLGPAWVLWSLGFRKGTQAENRYGAVPNREELDYLVVGENRRAKDTLVNDVYDY